MYYKIVIELGKLTNDQKGVLSEIYKKEFEYRFEFKMLYKTSMEHFYPSHYEVFQCSILELSNVDLDVLRLSCEKLKEYLVKRKFKIRSFCLSKVMEVWG